VRDAAQGAGTIEQVLDRLAQPGDPVQRLALLLAAAEGVSSIDARRALEHAREAAAIALGRGDRRAHAQALYLQGHCLDHLLDHGGALELYAQALAAFEATSDSMAITPSPRSTMPARRRALSGSRVARSSMPSAPDVLTTVNDTGCASRLASAVSDCAVMAWMLRPMSGRSASTIRPVDKPDHGVSSSLTAR